MRQTYQLVGGLFVPRHSVVPVIANANTVVADVATYLSFDCPVIDSVLLFDRK